ncbi:uncharacterized protein LOC117317947 [Pecten maximus]|uniref:uncharacterized protein LOC117317947 n=1 Tax=Pecten maximus TaxID=6579 RepID=UPI0014587EE8|nr:uncharacterized protein LOC117317947 [Pecten maximus]
MKNIQTFLLCFTLTYTSASNCIMTERRNQQPGYRIDHGVFKTINSIGIAGCQKACLKLSVCQSVSYDKVTLVCLLGQFLDNKTFTGLNTDIFIWRNTSDEAFISLGPCRNRQCSVTETCVPLSSGSFTCMTNVRPIDLAVIIDGSRTIDEDEFYDIVNCTKYLVNELFDLRLAVTIFNADVSTPIYFDQFQNKADMLSGIDDNVIYPYKVGNELGQALQEVYNNVFNQSRGNRAEVNDVVLVFLSPNDMAVNNLDMSDTIKSAGISIVTVAIGSSTTGIAILQQVTSDPFEDNNLNVNSTEELYQISGTIVDTINKMSYLGTL